MWQNCPSIATPNRTRHYIQATLALGLHLESSLSWKIHVNTIISKASKRLYFLKQLRRAGVPPQQLLHFYTAVIRQVLEYASPVWHYSITLAQSHHLESIQKRAVHIIFIFTRGMSYRNMILSVANLTLLEDRRDRLSRSFVQNMCKPCSVLSPSPSPTPRNTSPISRLRSYTPFPRPTSRTKKFQSFSQSLRLQTSR